MKVQSREIIFSCGNKKGFMEKEAWQLEGWEDWGKKS